MFEPIVDIIRTKTREGWKSWAKERLIAFRIWAQENGEKSTIIAFVVGLFIALFIKVFFFFLAIGILLLYLVWFIARPEGEVTNSDEPPSSPT